eukprot:PhF_6_TR21876/c0_g2_i1/m.31076/K12873/BUD31, G10; bud site selection protein 31
MPKLKPGTRKLPAGYELIADKLDEFENIMREAIATPSDGKRKVEMAWPILHISRQRTRYVYDAYRAGTITQDVVDFCVSQGFIDGGLIDKWPVAGYENLCCVKCVMSNGGTVCVCRVPKKDSDGPVQCNQCGCNGCASGKKAGSSKLMVKRPPSVVAPAKEPAPTTSPQE